MDAERIFKMVLTSLSYDILSLEDKIERVINTDMDGDEKIESIKTLLADKVIKEASLAKFTTMIGNNNVTNKTTEENGQI